MKTAAKESKALVSTSESHRYQIEQLFIVDMWPCSSERGREKEVVVSKSAMRS
jgi:hypothetical protein